MGALEGRGRPRRWARARVNKTAGYPRAPERGVVNVVCLILATVLTLGMSTSVLGNFSVMSGDLVKAVRGSGVQGLTLCSSVRCLCRRGPTGMNP